MSVNGMPPGAPQQRFALPRFVLDSGRIGAAALPNNPSVIELTLAHPVLPFVFCAPITPDLAAQFAEHLAALAAECLAAVAANEAAAVPSAGPATCSCGEALTSRMVVQMHADMGHEIPAGLL